MRCTSTCRQSQIINYKSQTCHVYTIVVVGETVSHKMLEVVSYCLKIQADMMLHIHESCGQNGRTNCSNFAHDVSAEVIKSVTFVYKQPNCQQTLVEDA